MPHLKTTGVSHVSRVVFAVRGIPRAVPRSTGDLANGYAEHPANDIEQTSNGKRDRQSDQEDHERNRQRDARCSNEGDRPLKKRPSSAGWPGNVDDVAEPFTSLARIGEQCLSRRAVCQLDVESLRSRRPALAPRGYCPDIRWCFLCKARFLLTRPSGTCHAQPGLDDAASLASRSTRPAGLPL